MRNIITILVSVFLGIFCCAVKAQGKISVKITTNVNSFSCDCKENDFIYANKTISTAKDNTTILFPLVSFNCPKKLMERDLQELFKSEVYPYAKLSILEKDINKNTGDTTIKFSLTLKDVTKTYEVLLANVKRGDKNYLSGDQMIQLTNFNVEPPTKMLGVIRVRNEVNIAFLIPQDQILAY
ncbi:hypothetical protein NBRC110019_01210 [Neptunitalea chrysea]|uniref:Lipid/polyisoprenoid-binding YceI-like domain-containing protein n=1 Tax=Neptunitalea chrysea TaxID=1647581 RepID=A0A9W6EUA1_9FLAO|nr:YceI family protein [Neptunitalea chrysea]GLB51082.1 hypothetical protein NBRC110019_01210 [Neptunitalea chrysea]